MKWKSAFFILAIAFVVMNCSKSKQLTVERSRMIAKEEIVSYHKDVNIRVGWIPYQDQKVVQTGKNEWKVIKDSKTNEGMIPAILMTYPESSDTLILDMNIDNHLLGKLIKHTAMTQLPVSRPFNTYFESAKCQTCHPQFVEVDFEK